MKIRFDYPNGSEGWQRDVEMLTVPRKGESVFLRDGSEGEFDDGDEYYIRHVSHTPGVPDHDMYVVLEVPRG